MTFRCVECGHDGLVDHAASDLVCPACGARFPRHPSGIPVLVGKSSRFDARALAAAPLRTKVDLARARRHWRAPRLAECLARKGGPRLLSHGCGDAGDRDWLVAEGFSVTSFDLYPTRRTDVIADAHALPFPDASFDVVASLSVLQIVHDPFVAMGEVTRVLAPGGIFVGTVAFLEPPYDESRFHMTQFGLREVLARAGLVDVEIAAGYSWLEALAPSFWPWNRVAALARASRVVSHAKYEAGVVLARAYYALRGRALPESERLNFAGALVFYARRPFENIKPSTIARPPASL